MKRFCWFVAFAIVAALRVPMAAMATEPVPLDGSVTSVAAGTPLYVPAGWVAGSRGLAMQAPSQTQFYFTITKHAVSDTVVIELTRKQSKAYWSPTVIAVTSGGPWGELAHFNPRIGAGFFAREWEYDIPGGLPAGEYTFFGGATQTRTGIDLLWYFEGQHSAMRMQPGEAFDYGFDFTVH